jgi:hypothetical protein
MDEKQYTLDDLKKIGATWLDRIAHSEKREKGWIDEAAKAESAYLCGDPDTDNTDSEDVPDFNILHSNVETIVPSIYNSTPVPDIRPRHNVKDDIGKQVSDVFERVIAMQVDDNALDAEIEASAQDTFLAGRGVVRVKFDADVDQKGYVTGERLEYEVVSWRDYREGPAKRWKNVPWVAFRHCISQADLRDLERDEFKTEYNKDPEYKSPEDEDKDVDLWEIWCKDTGKVYFVVKDTQKVVDIQDDPLGLRGFFPMAAPVQPITGTGRRTPVCPYQVYKTLANELDKITRRINAIVSGLKVRGLVASNAEDLENLAEADDNQLVPISGLEGLANAGGIQNAIAWWPVDQAITVLRELYIQRDQTKQTIYEITGISDIIRGQGAASETATAQQIKTEWGALRIKKMQRLIERQVRDLFVISAEIIAQHFTPDTLEKASGIPITEEMAAFIQQPLDHYRIDVESDSTVRADLTRGRSEMAEFLQGTAQFFGAMAPIVQQAPQAAEPIAEMYAAFTRQFNLGKQAEDALEQFIEMSKQAATQQQPNPEKERMEAEMAFKREELQLKAQGEQGKQALEMQKLQLQTQNLALDGQNKQAELMLKNRELGIKEDETTLKERQAEFGAVTKLAEIEMEETQERPVKFDG